LSVREGISGVGTRVAAVALVGIGLAAVTLLGLRRGPTVEPAPPGEEPIEVEPASLVIRSFSQSRDSGEALLTVGFTIDPFDPRSQIRWNFGDGSPEDLNVLVVNHIYDRAGDFNGFVEVIDSMGNSERINFSVLVSAPMAPPPGQQDIITNFFQGESVIFVGQSVSFSIALGVQTQSIQWEFGDGTNRILNQTSVDHQYNKAGTFEGFVEAVDLNGDKEVIPFTVIVQPSPFEITARIDIGPGAGAILEPGEVIDFRLQLGGGTPPFVSIEWDFGDGTFDRTNSKLVSHVYNQVGNFSVVARITDSVGETAIATKGVIIQTRSIQFGDVAVTIQALTADFDWRIRLQNLRNDLSIDGDSLLRIFDAPGFGSRQHFSKRTGHFLSPGETESDFLVNPADLPVNQPLILFAEFQEGVTQRLLGEASEQFSVSAPELPPVPLVCEAGFVEENGVCVPENGPEPPPPPEPPAPGTRIVSNDFKKSKFTFEIPNFFGIRITPVVFSLPANTLRVKFARVFVQLKIDYGTFADAKILFNGQELAKITFGFGEQNQFKSRDLVITGLVKLAALNDLTLNLTSSDFIFNAVATVELASVFVEWEEPG